MGEKEYEENADSSSNLESLFYNKYLHLKLNVCNFYQYASVLHCFPFMFYVNTLNLSHVCILQTICCQKLCF